VTYLVDANVLSEATKPEPHSKAIEWLRRNERELAVDPIILGEIRFGIHLLPAGKRRRRLETWFDSGVARIVCVPWDVSTGLRWAKLLADMRRSGESLPIKDSLIAATALVHGFIVVTRNTRDFRKTGVKVLDPFA
jgi:predicted nucleic acid-binding protein